MIETSVIVPCRNEEKFIAKCCESIVSQDYPKDKMEVLFVDGMSEDGTREIIKNYAGRYPFIRLIDNNKKITPCALNVGIRNAKGKIIVRMDAHTGYPPQYITKGIGHLKRTGADVVGGPIITKPGNDTVIAKSIALATSHPFGVGNSRFRTVKKECYVDTVPFGVYRREVFDRVRVFDERLARNQDNELCNRIINSGGKILLTPELTSEYYNQPTITGLIRQALKTGMWNVVTFRISPTAFRWRHFAPFAFVTSLLILFIASLIYPWAVQALIGLLLLYGSVAIFSTFTVWLKERTLGALLLPLVFPAYHISYGFGTLRGVVQMVLHRKPEPAS